MQRRGIPQVFFRQSGQGLFILLALLLVIGTSLVFNFARPGSLNIDRDKQTAAALAMAKDALIGYAASDSNRPGELPCPDVDNDGASTPISDYSGSNCVSLIGRLPWVTLGLPDLRDGNGERLWYALSNSFHANGSTPINSDTLGQLTVTGANPANNVIAIVLAPGQVLSTQVRDSANQNNPANYLEGGNESGTGNYLTGPASGTFNDRLLIITTADLIPVVEQRVARELRTILQQYKAAVGVYTWADVADGDATNNVGNNRGRIPYLHAAPTDWGLGGAPTLPAWFISNNWSQLIYYTVGRNYLMSCSTCEAGQTTLSVDGAPGKEVVLLTPGPAGAGRPVPYPWTNWAAYLEDPQNNNNINTGKDSYVTPTSTAYTRDRIYTIP
ncbi:MAG: hypothetical protein ACREUV_00240 [Burkholderiales bacterium]